MTDASANVSTSMERRPITASVRTFLPGCDASVTAASDVSVMRNQRCVDEDSIMPSTRRSQRNRSRGTPTFEKLCMAGRVSCEALATMPAWAWSPAERLGSSRSENVIAMRSRDGSLPATGPPLHAGCACDSFTSVTMRQSTRPRARCDYPVTTSIGSWVRTDSYAASATCIARIPSSPVTFTGSSCITAWMNAATISGSPLGSTDCQR